VKALNSIEDLTDLREVNTTGVNLQHQVFRLNSSNERLCSSLTSFFVFSSTVKLPDCIVCCCGKSYFEDNRMNARCRPKYPDI
jgi:hypothetical protein